MKEWSTMDISGKSVGECLYPGSVIHCCLLLKISCHLCLRRATGFAKSLLLLPDRGIYAVSGNSTLCRRQHPVSCEVSYRPDRGESLDIAIDSTVYGEGEWKVRRHGGSQRRTWRKLHAGIDVNTQEIAADGLTGNDKDDAATAETVLKGAIGRIRSFRGDGACDDPDFRKVLGSEIHPIIPPPKYAVIRKRTKKPPEGC